MKKKNKVQVIDGVPRVLRRIILKAVSDYRWQLGMQVWKISVQYDKEDKEIGLSLLSAASCDVNRRYLEAVISIYPLTIKKFVEKKWDEGEIRSVVAHEVSHIVTQHFFDVATAQYRDEGEMKDAWETCTTVIGRLLYDLQKKK